MDGPRRTALGTASANVGAVEPGRRVNAAAVKHPTTTTASQSCTCFVRSFVEPS